MNPEIKTSRILLRKFVEADRNMYAKLIMDEEVNLHIPGGATKTLSDAHYWFDLIFETYKDQENKKHNEMWAECPAIIVRLHSSFRSSSS